jgi:hypothetical protein
MNLRKPRKLSPLNNRNHRLDRHPPEGHEDQCADWLLNRQDSRQLMIPSARSAPWEEPLAQGQTPRPMNPQHHPRKNRSSFEPQCRRLHNKNDRGRRIPIALMRMISTGLQVQGRRPPFKLHSQTPCARALNQVSAWSKQQNLAFI